MVDRTVKELARPFPPRYVHQNPSGGGRYVTHSVVTQRLIEILGGPPDFTLVEVLRGDVAAIIPDPNGKSDRAKKGAPALTNVVVGAVCRMKVVLGAADEWGSATNVEEVGDCEDPHNWPHDGARLKDAMSDAYKRCAMRLGCGLHLWSKDQSDYFLFDHLNVEVGSGDGRSVAGNRDASGSPTEASVRPVPVSTARPSDPERGGDASPPSRTAPSDGSTSTALCPHTRWEAAPRAGYELCRACFLARKAGQVA